MSDPIAEFFGRAKQVKLTEQDHIVVEGMLAKFMERNPVRAEDLERQIESMDSSAEQVLGAAREISLEKTEKDALYDEMCEFMEAHPVRPRLSLYESLNALREFLIRPFTLRTMPATLAVVALLVTSGGTISYAAEDSVPGDILYPVKVGINEPIYSAAVSLDNEKSARWEMRRMERRLEEAEKLALLEKMDPEHLEKLGERLTNHVQHLEARVALLTGEEMEAAEEITSEAETSLEAHEEILQILEKQRELQEELKGLLSGVGEFKGQFSSSHMRHEAALFGKNGGMFDRRLGFAKKMAGDLKENIDTDEAREHIAGIHDLLLDARMKYEAGEHEEAMMLSKEARGKAHKMRVLMKARRDLNMDFPFGGGMMRRDAFVGPDVLGVVGDAPSERDSSSRAGKDAKDANDAKDSPIDVSPDTFIRQPYTPPPDAPRDIRMMMRDHFDSTSSSSIRRIAPRLTEDQKRKLDNLLRDESISAHERMLRRAEIMRGVK